MLQQLLFLAQIRPFWHRFAVVNDIFFQNQVVLKTALKEIKR